MARSSGDFAASLTRLRSKVDSHGQCFESTPSNSIADHGYGWDASAESQASGCASIGLVSACREERRDAREPLHSQCSSNGAEWNSMEQHRAQWSSNEAEWSGMEQNGGQWRSNGAKWSRTGRDGAQWTSNGAEWSRTEQDEARWSSNGATWNGAQWSSNGAELSGAQWSSNGAEWSRMEQDGSQSSSTGAEWSRLGHDDEDVNASDHSQLASNHTLLFEKAAPSSSAHVAIEGTKDGAIEAVPTSEQGIGFNTLAPKFTPAPVGVPIQSEFQSSRSFNPVGVPKFTPIAPVEVSAHSAEDMYFNIDSELVLNNGMHIGAKVLAAGSCSGAKVLAAGSCSGAAPSNSSIGSDSRMLTKQGKQGKNKMCAGGNGAQPRPVGDAPPANANETGNSAETSEGIAVDATAIEGSTRRVETSGNSAESSESIAMEAPAIEGSTIGVETSGDSAETSESIAMEAPAIEGSATGVETLGLPPGWIKVPLGLDDYYYADLQRPSAQYEFPYRRAQTWERIHDIHGKAWWYSLTENLSFYENDPNSGWTRMIDRNGYIYWSDAKTGVRFFEPSES